MCDIEYLTDNMLTDCFIIKTNANLEFKSLFNHVNNRYYRRIKMNCF